MNKAIHLNDFLEGETVGNAFYRRIDEVLRFRAINISDSLVEFSIINRERGVVDTIVINASEPEVIALEAKRYIKVFEY